MEENNTDSAVTLEHLAQPAKTVMEVVEHSNHVDDDGGTMSKDMEPPAAPLTPPVSNSTPNGFDDHSDGHNEAKAPIKEEEGVSVMNGRQLFGSSAFAVTQSSLIEKSNDELNNTVFDAGPVKTEPDPVSSSASPPPEDTETEGKEVETQAAVVTDESATETEGQEIETQTVVNENTEIEGPTNEDNEPSPDEADKEQTMADDDEKHPTDTDPTPTDTDTTAADTCQLPTESAPALSTEPDTVTEQQVVAENDPIAEDQVSHPLDLPGNTESGSAPIEASSQEQDIPKGEQAASKETDDGVPQSVEPVPPSTLTQDTESGSAPTEASSQEQDIALGDQAVSGETETSDGVSQPIEPLEEQVSLDAQSASPAAEEVADAEMPDAETLQAEGAERASTSDEQPQQSCSMQTVFALAMHVARRRRDTQMDDCKRQLGTARRELRLFQQDLKRVKSQLIATEIKCKDMKTELQRVQVERDTESVRAQKLTAALAAAQAERLNRPASKATINYRNNQLANSNNHLPKNNNVANNSMKRPSGGRLAVHSFDAKQLRLSQQSPPTGPVCNDIDEVVLSDDESSSRRPNVRANQQQQRPGPASKRRSPVGNGVAASPVTLVKCAQQMKLVVQLIKEKTREGEKMRLHWQLPANYPTQIINCFQIVFRENENKDWRPVQRFEKSERTCDLTPKDNHRSFGCYYVGVCALFKYSTPDGRNIEPRGPVSDTIVKWDHRPLRNVSTDGDGNRGNAQQQPRPPHNNGTVQTIDLE